jgi:hypothetical protein
LFLRKPPQRIGANAHAARPTYRRTQSITFGLTNKVASRSAATLL